MSPYAEKYPGTWELKSQDDKENLRRWFDSHKSDKYAPFPYEWERMLIEVIPWSDYKRRLRNRYVAHITTMLAVNEMGVVRHIEFDHTAPEPPTLRYDERSYKPRPAPAELAPQDEPTYRRN